MESSRAFASSLISPDFIDEDALVSLYEATNGVDWLRSDNWLTDAPLDAWFGVTTDSNGRVITLVLSKNMLAGLIPPDLGQLAELEELRLEENGLSGLIPQN